MIDRVPLAYELLAVLGHATLAILAGGHALLNKPDPRAAWGWIAVCLLFPLGGAFLYLVFGIDRVEMKARRELGFVTRKPREVSSRSLEGVANADQLRELLRVGGAMTGRVLAGGNSIDAFYTGEQAYDAMLEAIEGAQRCVRLCTYIYENDDVGKRFALALDAARRRGVEVRVLLDGVSDAFHWPRSSRMLARLGISVALFLPPRWFPPMLHLNLRQHRKILVVDGHTGFTGGMNIESAHLSSTPLRRAIRDVHFRLRGPVVAQLGEVFATDWENSSDETLCELAPCDKSGDAWARALDDGPNDDLDILALVLLGAIAVAHKRVWIMTPYFVPPLAIAAALQSAALRGVDVCVIVPRRSDHPWIDWASRRLLSPLLQHGVDVRLRPPPFAHCKLLLVDDQYLQFGSVNLDTRSLRLNFELNVETLDATLAADTARHFAEVRAESARLTAQQVAARPFPVRVRDAFFWLFSPYM
jgi:cardiolipin synthase